MTIDFKSLIKSKKTINLGYASVNQIINQIIFLITIPFLTRKLGIEKFGIVMSAITLSNYFLIIVDYGFFYTATKKLQESENKSETLIESYNSIFFLKLLFIILSSIGLIILVFFSTNYFNYWQAFFWAFGIVIGNLLIPSWLFQGLELFKHLSFFNLISRSIYALSVFLFIKQPENYLIVPISYTLGTWISGLFCTGYIFKKFKLKLFIPTISNLKIEAKEGLNLLTNNLLYSAYSNSGTIILGYTSTMSYVGYYAVAEKVILAFRQFMSIISQVVYPHFCKLYNDKVSLQKFHNKYTSISMPFSVLITLVLFFFSEEIAKIISGTSYSEHISFSIKYFALIPILLTINTFKFYYIVLNNKVQEYNLYFLLVVLANISLTIFLSKIFSASGAAMALLITEISTTIIIHILTSKKSINVI